MLFEKHGGLTAYFEAWLKKRIPLSRSVTLNQKRIFILPSKVGWVFIAFLLLLFVTSVNYQNNLMLSLTCLLVSLFVTGIIATYQNMSGLTIEALPSDNVFREDEAMLHVQLSCLNNHVKHGFYVGFKDTASTLVNRVSCERVITVTTTAHKRGLLMPPRLGVFSYYPLGLFKCWTWLALDFPVYVYPKATQHEFVESDFNSTGSNTEGLQTSANKAGGTDDFYGLKQYQSGDNNKRIAWRHYAKTNVLLSKEFSATRHKGEFLDWFALHGLPEETRLEILCGWVLGCFERDEIFGLRLPNQVVDLDEGELHRDKCLMALSKYVTTADKYQGDV